ncbi:MAG: hypothetical protein AB7Y46_00195 [Armatimonadota bacterium]
MAWALIVVAAPAMAERIAVTATLPGGATQTQYMEVPAGGSVGEMRIDVVTRLLAQGEVQALGGVTVSLPEYGTTATTSPEGTAVLRAHGSGTERVEAQVIFDFAACPAEFLALLRALAGVLSQAVGLGGAGTDAGPPGLEAMALAGECAIRQAVICLGFDERSGLTGVQESFPAGTEKIALYLEIAGAGPNWEVQITWYLEEKIIGRQLLLVSGDSKSISYLYAGGRQTLWPGAYAAEMRENGRLVGRLVFRVEGER